MSQFHSTNEPWSGFKQQLRKTWRKLTEADVELITRDREQLVLVLKNRYRSAIVRQATDDVSHKPTLRSVCDGDRNEIDVLMRSQRGSF